jgi:hypothetical protein
MTKVPTRPKSEEKYVSASGSGQALVKLKVYEDDTATVWNESHQRQLYPPQRRGLYAPYDEAKEFFDGLRAVAGTGA